MRRSMHIGIAVVFGMVFSAAPGLAHHLWIAPEPDGFAVCRGMMGDRVDPYDPARVVQVRAYDAGGREISVRRTDAAQQVTVAPDREPALMAVECAWGQRVNTTQGKKLMGRKEAEAQGLRVISAFFSTQYAKTLLASGPAATASLGLKLEIVPEKDPLSPKAGNTFPVRLLFEGAPLPEVDIYTLDDQKIATDAEGRADLPLTGKGTFLFYARHKTPPPPDSELDYLLFTSFLIFEVK